MTLTSDELLTSEQTAALLGLKPKCLDVWRLRGQGPTFIKLGTKKQSPVRYKRSDVEGWLEANSFASTSAYSAKGN